MAAWIYRWKSVTAEAARSSIRGGAWATSGSVSHPERGAPPGAISGAAQSYTRRRPEQAQEPNPGLTQAGLSGLSGLSGLGGLGGLGGMSAGGAGWSS